ncbi:MAG TPA: hypothetical protein PKL73_10520 [Polyangiaceae bacterium]|nr:hypothetical protein [Polyangiaceae bacterium]HOD23298.1 hypothetical protein [Polyangiaceae bacterium]HOR34841.1 hypothetical protein [Polyangiaceae bacterium]
MRPLSQDTVMTGSAGVAWLDEGPRRLDDDNELNTTCPEGPHGG